MQSPCCLVAKSFWDSMDCSSLDSSLPGILQAGILGWVAISFSRGSSWPRDQTRVLLHCRPLRHQGSPSFSIVNLLFCCCHLILAFFFFFSYFFLLCCLSGNGSFHSGEEPVRTVSSVTSDTVLPLRNHTWSCLFWAFCSPSVTAPVLKLGSRLLHLIAGRLGNFCISQCSETKLFQNSSHAVLIPFHKGTKVCCLYSTFFSSQNS